jgi:hypothetical protein
MNEIYYRFDVPLSRDFSLFFYIANEKKEVHADGRWWHLSKLKSQLGERIGR